MSASSWWLWLGLTLWLVGERVLVASEFRTGLGALSAACFVVAFGLDASAALTSARELRLGQAYRSAAGLLLSAAAAVYAVGAHFGFDGVLFAACWLAPLACGLTARLAADRAFRAGPLDGRRIAVRTRAGFGFGAALVVLSLLNYAVVTHDVQKDVSYRTVHEPSAQVRELVAQLREPVRCVLIFASGNEVLPVIAPYFEALSRGSRAFSVSVQDPALVTELRRRHNVRGNGYALLLTGHGERQRGASFHIGADLRDARRVLRTLDAHVANHLSVLARPVRPVYVTTGHGERTVAGDIEESPGRFLRDLEQLMARFNVRLHRLGVSEGLAREVPSDAAAVLVLGPERPFLPEESRALADYARRGGRLWLGLEPGVDAGLSDLLGLVGVASLDAPLVCTQSFVVRSRTAADRALIQTQRYADHPTMDGVRESPDRPHAVLVRATALALARAPASGRVVTTLESEADCFLDRNADFTRTPTEPEGHFPLLVAAELPATGVVAARVVISADGDLPTDQVLRNAANTLITLDIMRWLVGDDGMRSVAMLEDDLPVLHQRSEDRGWFYVSAFGVPLPLFFAALWQWRRRQVGAAI